MRDVDGPVAPAGLAQRRGRLSGCNRKIGGRPVTFAGAGENGTLQVETVTGDPCLGDAGTGRCGQ